ncbi:hypothetical protein FHX42_000444 [Saccharopolyspora lacisalsi]|uniref:Pyroglutamyl peptidase n=2 Tax=Halosaccharopolyspora lacisalsi TaxID=1000566 RepID=A0A839DV01_9PSEU|nr:hypothetical protein [Halosaccharopolyspora lacisalsi]
MRRSAVSLRSCALVLLSVSLVAGPGVATATERTDCYDESAPLTVEERRLDDSLVPGAPAAGPELVERAGFGPLVTRFTTRLCEQPNARAAAEFVERRGERLWETAVARAQGRFDHGDLDSYDDRPLYWARLLLTRAVRQWRPDHELVPRQRAHLLRELDRASRGMSSQRFPGGKATRVMISGFDPFGLDDGNLNRGNPAGVAALRLDGRTFDAPTGRITVQTVALPVLWGAFDRGIVEHAYGSALLGRRRPDLIMTLSQGRPGRFDIERWAGRWRGGAADNNGVHATGPVPDAAGWPQPAAEFIETTLPHRAMLAAESGPYPVRFNTRFCSWPDSDRPGAGDPVCHEDGEPAPDAVAASGSGEDYLSNESMYRSNRLRLGLGGDSLAGGHLHTPVLNNPPGRLTGDRFTSDRHAIADETTILVRAAGRAVGHPIVS